MNIPRLKIAIKNGLQDSKRYRRLSPMMDIWWYFRLWDESLEPEVSPLSDGRPWLTFSAISYLESVLRPEFKVFEYSTGGSTIFFAQRVQSVISVEHDESWLDRTRDAMHACGLDNWQEILARPELLKDDRTRDISSKDDYVSHQPEYRGYSFVEYARTIDSYPDGHFDAVLIDGRARPSCFKHSMTKVRRGGYIIYDNTERPHYARSLVAAASTFKRLDYPGMVPYSKLSSMTTVLIRK